MRSGISKEPVGRALNMARRSLVQLERVVREASTDAEKAQAHLELGLFHDNNGREAEAIPHYEQALVWA